MASYKYNNIFNNNINSTSNAGRKNPLPKGVLFKWDMESQKISINWLLNEAYRDGFILELEELEGNLLAIEVASKYSKYTSQREFISWLVNYLLEGGVEEVHYIY